MQTQDINAIFERDSRIAYVIEYDGFVANSYKWPCPRVATVHYRDGSTSTKQYDAKRTYGRGPDWVAFSERNGRLASG